MKKQPVNRIIKQLFTLSLSILFVPALFSSNFARAEISKSVGTGTVNWSTGKIRVTGSGVPPKEGLRSQKRLLARRSAVADAYRQLAKLLQEIKVDGTKLVEDYQTKSDLIRTQVSVLIKGAREVEQKDQNENNIKVIMEVNIYGVNSLASVMQPAIFKDKKIPQRSTRRESPQPLSISDIPKDINYTTEISGTYTGVIVDCRGLDVQPAISPSILDSKGQEIFIGNRALDPDFIITKGIVAYSSTIEEALMLKRVGKKPLILRAIETNGVNKTDAVLSNLASKLLLSADRTSDFLKDSNVVFVID